jgi:hypothetical protein
MGSLKRQLKKRSERHLRLIEGGKTETFRGVDSGRYSSTLADAQPHPLTKPVLGDCTKAREEYELGEVACCPSCHAKSQTSYVEGVDGYFEVCCTVRQSLCPGEGGAAHRST